MISTWSYKTIPQVRALVDAGVAVVGHIGLCPQSHAAQGGYRVQGRTAAAAQQLLAEVRYTNLTMFLKKIVVSKRAVHDE